MGTDIQAMRMKQELAKRKKFSQNGTLYQMNIGYIRSFILLHDNHKQIIYPTFWIRFFPKHFGEMVIYFCVYKRPVFIWQPFLVELSLQHTSRDEFVRHVSFQK